MFPTQTYTADIFFAQNWTDDRLRLPNNMTSDYRRVMFLIKFLRLSFCLFNHLNCPKMPWCLLRDQTICVCKFKWCVSKSKHVKINVSIFQCSNSILYIIMLRMVTWKNFSRDCECQIVITTLRLTTGEWCSNSIHYNIT